ncbi:MAG: PQQ-binding-like beta-propeller repeat protein [Actinobacteria bacterium]|nr:PQQ-binding-like beta-propeller repeat protein [Actinomycetota bacterium]
MGVKRGVATVLVALVATAGAGIAAAGEGGGKEKGNRWRQLGYDLASTFHNRDSSLTPKRAAALETAWEYEAPQSVNGAPAVAGDRVYVLSRDALVALDSDSGTEVWKRDDIGGSSSPTIAGGVVFALGGDPTLWAVDAETGEDVWSVPADDQEFASGFSSPVVTKDAVIVGLSSIEEVAAEANATYRGGVAAFDRKTGEELWRYRTAEPPYNGVSVWSTVSVDVDAGIVFATTGNNYTEEAGPTSDSIIALDLATGEPRWIRQVTEGDVFTVPTARSQDSDFGTNPILFEAEIGGERRKLVGAGQKSGVFWVLDRETGEIVWQRQVSDGSALIGGVFNNGAYDGTRIIVAGNYGPPGPGPADDRPRTGEVGTSVLMALNPATGEIEWQQPLDNYVWAPITLADGVGFVAVDRELRAFDTKTGEELFRLETVGTISSAPVVAGDSVYFGSGLGYFPPTKSGQTVYALEA